MAVWPIERPSARRDYVITLDTSRFIATWLLARSIDIVTKDSGATYCPV